MRRTLWACLVFWGTSMSLSAAPILAIGPNGNTVISVIEVDGRIFDISFERRTVPLIGALPYESTLASIIRNQMNDVLRTNGEQRILSYVDTGSIPAFSFVGDPFVAQVGSFQFINVLGVPRISTTRYIFDDFSSELSDRGYRVYSYSTLLADSADRFF